MLMYFEIHDEIVDLSSIRLFKDDEDLLRHTMQKVGKRLDFSYMRAYEVFSDKPPEPWEDFDIEMEGLTGIVRLEEEYGVSLLDLVGMGEYIGEIVDASEREEIWENEGGK